MPVEVKFVSTKNEDDEQKLRDRAIDLSHEWMQSLDEEDCKPNVVMMCLAHTLGHILMAAPNEMVMKASMLFFMQEVDFKHLVEINKQGGGPDDDDEDDIGEPISAAIN